MFRGYVNKGGTPAPVFANYFKSLLLAQAIGCLVICCLASFGVVLHAVLRESCSSNLNAYLIAVTVVSNMCCFAFFFVWGVARRSDAYWYMLTGVCLVCSVAQGAVLAYGMTILFSASGVLGLTQCVACTSQPCPNNGYVCASEITARSTANCPDITTSNLYCNLSSICYYKAPVSFWYSCIVTVLSLILTLSMSTIVFARMVPSFAAQVTRWRRLLSSVI